MSHAIQKLAERLISLKWQMATAESCTGGLIAARCTDLAGSSAWFDRGFVTYSNDAKTQMLGVPATLLATYGAVSDAVVQAMALGAVNRSLAQVSVAVTGIAGPTGASAEKPMGTVWFAWCIQGAVFTECQHFEGTRNQIRQTTASHALAGLLARLPVPT